MKHESAKTIKRASQRLVRLWRKNKLYLYFGILVFSCFCVLIFSKAAHSPAIAGRTSPDAIAIRVIPNHQHYSPMRWYKEQGFTSSAGSGQAGSPQSLIIDGYEAIRDGRTVYVNAANINDQGTSDPSDDVLYTNIYLMSYNQDAEPATIAIVNQLLRHWHFNTDLPDVGRCVGAEGNLGAICLIDLECPTNEYCNSAKAKVTRDTRRLADLAEIKIYLANYKSKHNHYPDLSAGSYLPNKTISTWPSWQDTLANELNITLPADPINRLGDCGDDRFDPITCWDDQNKEFASDLDLPELPAQSRVYFYWANSQGNTANYCAQMETSYIYNNIAEFNCFEEEAPNNPPVISGVSLPDAYLVQPYSGYIKAFDPDGDQLNWTLTINSGCEQWSNLRLDNTAIAGQKAIQADHAGQIGDNCNITITINDNRENGSISENYAITVVNRPPKINSSPITAAAACVDYYYQVVAVDADGHSLQYSATGLPDNLTINQNTGLISGQPQTIGSYNITVIVTDEYNDQGKQAYTLAVTDEVFQVNPISNATIYVYPAEAVLPLHYGPVQFNHTATVTTANPVTYSMQNNPDWLAINSISGHIQGTPTDNVNDPGNYNITVTAVNNYGASYSNSFVLTVLKNGWNCLCADSTCENETCIDPVYGTVCPGTKLCCPDIDNDGYDNCNIGDLGDDGLIIDCNDNNSSIHPNAPEICGNGIDDDCDGEIDEGCGPGDVEGCTDQDGDEYPGTDVGTPPSAEEINEAMQYYSLYQHDEKSVAPSYYSTFGFRERCNPAGGEGIIGGIEGDTIKLYTTASFWNWASYDRYNDPDKFRVFIPPGAKDVAVALAVADRTRIGFVSNWKQPIQGTYDNINNYDDFINLNPISGSIRLSDYANGNDIVHTKETHGWVGIIHDHTPPSSDGGWLYIQNIYKECIWDGMAGGCAWMSLAKITVLVDKDIFTDWYNSVEWDESCAGTMNCCAPDCSCVATNCNGCSCLDSYGDPLPLIGSADEGVCDTTDPNFDCDDTNPNIHPNAPEICGNGIDDDCDGEIDEGCGPGDVEGCLDKDGDTWPGTTDSSVDTTEASSYYSLHQGEYVQVDFGGTQNFTGVIGYHDNEECDVSRVTCYPGGIFSAYSYVLSHQRIGRYPKKFRIYIPPWAKVVYITNYLARDGINAIAVRWKKPPEGDYSYINTNEEYYNIGYDGSYSLPQLESADKLIINSGGAQYIVDSRHEIKQGGWLYMKTIYTSPGTSHNDPRIGGTHLQLKVDGTTYRDWYNSVEWETDGDPLPLLELCDISALNFDCDDNNPNIHPDAVEICGNGIDEDCDGYDMPCFTQEDIEDAMQYNSVYQYENSYDAIGFREAFNPKSLTIYSSGLAGLPFRICIDAEDTACKLTSYSDLPDDFRLYIPPGTKYARVTIPTTGYLGFKFGSAVRFLQPPEGDYSYINNYDDTDEWEGYGNGGYGGGITLSELEDKDRLIHQRGTTAMGGKSTIIYDRTLEFPLKKGGWVYAKELFADYLPTAISVILSVDLEAYTDWYNSAEWDEYGDPLLLIGN